MSSYWRALPALLWCIFFSLFALLRYPGYFPDGYQSIYVTQPQAQLLPAGEAVPGTYFEHLVNWEQVEPWEHIAASEACVSLLMADYGGRRNHGFFRVTLSVAGEPYSMLGSAYKVRDLSYQQFCFAGLTLADIIGKPVTVALEGEDSRPGSAVSGFVAAGATGETAYGRRDLDKGDLVVNIGGHYQAQQKRLQATFLMLLCLLAGTFLLCPARTSPAAAPVGEGGGR